MISILSFSAKGSFAAWKDPSVTTNQLVYFIPSKSAVVGMIGAMLGIKRSNILGEIYEKPYLELYRDIAIGIRLDSDPSKVTFNTNHRTLKEPPKTKPVKTELLENPEYTIYVISENNQKLYDIIKNHNFIYTPCLGHAYCPALISNPVLHDAVLINDSEKNTDCVVLDESETLYDDFSVVPIGDGSVMVERHIHHYFDDDGNIKKRVLKHWIPNSSVCEIRHDSNRKISNFYEIDDKIVCIY